jgi:serine protease Do
VSCATGEFELVGVYHAGYARGSALNVVIAIDQLRDLLTTLKRVPRPRSAESDDLDGQDRAALAARARLEVEPFFPFGGLAAAVRVRDDGALVFELMKREFPLMSQPALVIEDVADPQGGAGKLGRIWAGNRQGLREIDRSTLDAESQGVLAKLVDALRRDALAATSYRAAARLGMASRERYQNVTRLERGVRQTAASRQDLAQAGLELAEKLCPAAAEASGTLGEALASPRTPGDGAAAELAPASGGSAPVPASTAPPVPAAPGPLPSSPRS